MADEGMVGLRDALGKILQSEHADLLREGVGLVVREVMELEASRWPALTGMSALRSGRRIGMGIGSGSGIRGWGRSNWRSRSCGRGRTCRASSTRGSGSEQALLGVVMEAYTNGVSTRKVERLVEQLGVESMSKSRVSRICQALDERVEAFRNRPLEGAYPYLRLDARVELGRDMASGMVRRKARPNHGAHAQGRLAAGGAAVST